MANVYGSGSWDVVERKGIKYHRLRKMVKGKRKNFYGKTKAEAQRKCDEYLAESGERPNKKSTLTVCEVARDAIEARKKQLKETSYDYYQYAIKRLQKSDLGTMQLHSVTDGDVQNYINSLANEDSLSTIKRQKTCLSVAFSYAVNKGYIKQDFMRKVKLPNEENVKKAKREIVFLSTEERKMLETESKRKNTAKVHNGRIGAPLYGINAKAIVFFLHTGLRVGELRALMWDVVDFERGFVHIKRNAPSISNKITTPKRKASIRNVPLDNVARGILLDLSSDKKGDFVFHTDDGKLLLRSDIDRTLGNMVKRAGIEKKPTLHDLRHTYASELIRNGVDMKTVSVVLGHDDISTTMNTYVHKSEKDLEQLKSILD